jgi:FixJ family two-component response regulator
LDAIQRTLERDRTVRKERAQLEDLHERFETLTRREREVMRPVVTGLLNKQIDSELSTTEITVKTQGVRSRRRPFIVNWTRCLMSARVPYS